MKICAIICEFNPFHNGHKHLIEQAREITHCDAVLCLMSGNFTQRGEIALIDKYKRAKHAVMGGADIVIELPSVFATANAEIFSQGAIKLLSSCPDVEYLAFGTERGTAETFTETANILLNETKEFKDLLKENLKIGKSFAKARLDTLEALKYDNVDLELLKTPNAILGLEYTKAILVKQSKIQIVPIERKGSSYADTELIENYSSATAIKKAVLKGNIKPVKKNVPDYVFKDLPFKKQNNFKDYVLFSLLARSKKELGQIIDCNEGLENRIKALLLENMDYDQLLEKVCTRRYTTTRIKRIFLSNMLGIFEKDVREALKEDLYLKVLAVKYDMMNDLLQSLCKSKYPMITRQSNVQNLREKQEKFYNFDEYCQNVYSLITGAEIQHKPIFV